MQINCVAVRLDGRDDFDGYLMEARALGGGASSKPAVAGVGRWVGFPATAMLLNCRDRQSSAVTNVPSPYRMNNLTFQWEAPFRDVGDIFFVYALSLSLSLSNGIYNYCIRKMSFFCYLLRIIIISITSIIISQMILTS